MKIYSQLGEIPFKTFTFPDGQPHFSLDIKETREEALHATIEAPIRNSYELVTVLLAKDALSASGYRVALDIRYLMGARMDRRIDCNSPNTLEVVARILMAAGFSRIRVLDCHSEVGLRLLNAKNLLPFNAFNSILANYGDEPTIVIPDKGAANRVQKLANTYGHHIQGSKKRDPATGKLAGFDINFHDLSNHRCLIVDDICDGGGTFTGLAQVLRKAGAVSVELFITHGIFSKGLPIEGIDKVYTTDSYGQPKGVSDHLYTCIPISMKDMK